MSGHRQIVILVGTSGWQYKDWSGRFYPDGLPQRLWLEHYAKSFATVEINNAFYRLPERSTFTAWRERTPSDFCVAVKMSRYLTHIKRLREPQEPVARFLDHARGLGDRLGPVLVQLPPTLRGDPDLLDATLNQFPKSVKVAVEPRHKSWWTDETRAVLDCRKRRDRWQAAPPRANDSARDPPLSGRRLTTIGYDRPRQEETLA